MQEERADCTGDDSVLVSQGIGGSGDGGAACVYVRVVRAESGV